MKKQLLMASSVLAAATLASTLVGAVVQADTTDQPIVPVNATEANEAKLEQAKADVATATEKADQAQAAVDKQTVVVSEAEAAEKASAATEANAEVVVRQAEAEASQANNQAQADKAAVAEAETEVATAESQAQTAAEEKAAVDAEPVGKQTTTVVTHTPADDEEAGRPKSSTYSRTIYSGDTVEETIELTDKQKAQYDAGELVRYEPDNAAISRYAAEYINELRRLNGITSQVEVSDEAIAYALARANEEEVNGRPLSHSTHIAGTEKRVGENLATEMNGYTLSESQIGTIVSDKEMAYKLVLGWFTEYGNMEGHDVQRKYGHRDNMLFTTNAELGVAVTFDKEPTYSVPGAFEYTEGSGALTFITNNPSVSHEDSVKSGLSLSQDPATGEYTQLLNGKPLVFLPKHNFKYTYTKDVDTQAASVKRKLASDKLAAAQAQVVRAKDKLATAQTTAQASEAKAETAAQTLATAQADFAAAQTAHAEKIVALEAEVAKLQELEEANTAAQNDKAKSQDRYKDILMTYRSGELGRKYAEIVMSGKVPVAVVDSNGQIVDYRAEDKKPSVTPTPTEPKADEPKADEPKADVPKADVPKADEPKADTPKADEPKADVPKADEPKADTPKADTPKADEPKADVPKVDEPKADEPKADVPKVNEPKVDAPKAGVTYTEKGIVYSRVERSRALPETGDTNSPILMVGYAVLSLLGFHGVRRKL